MAGGISTFSGAGTHPGGTSTLGRFFACWGRDLYALIPMGLRPYPRAAHQFLWLSFAPDVLRIRRVVSGHFKDVARVELAGADAAAQKIAFSVALGKWRRQPLAIALPAECVLRKTITIPEVARDNLRQVVGFELPRHTPFNAEQAYFDHALRGIDERQARLNVVVTATPRRAIDDGLTLLRDFGYIPAAVVPEDEILTQPRYANLLPPQLRSGLGLARILALAGMALLTLTLLGAALAIPLWQKREVAIALDGQARQARQRAQVIDGLRQELARVGSVHRFLLEKKHGQPTAVALLDEVTKVLPDSTWLNQLQISGQEVVLTGETGTSSRLIQLMDGSELLGEANFKSPLIKTNNSIERFQLVVRVKGGGQVILAPKAEVDGNNVGANNDGARGI